MLYGIDISNWNSPKVETYRQADFMIHKATEGKSFVDRKIAQHVDEYRIERENAGQEPLLGFYHFGQPKQGNTVAAEAENFLSAVKTYIGKAIFSLDMEEGNRTYVDWALEWLEYVYSKTGVKSLIYTSASNLYGYDRIFKNNFGLWVANYKSNGNAFPEVKPETTGIWPFFTIWQWSNGQTPYKASKGKWFNDNVDQNIFNGDIEAWKKYCMSESNEKINEYEKANKLYHLLSSKYWVLPEGLDQAFYDIYGYIPK